MIDHGFADSPADFEEIPCPLCGSTSFEVHLLVQDRLSSHHAEKDKGPQELAYRIVACSSCGFLHLNPRPKPDRLESFYVSETYDPHRRRGGGVMGCLFRSARRLMLGWKAAAAGGKREPGYLLDIGCGTGEFAAEMRRRGWQSFGIEANRDAAEAAREKGVEVTVGDPADCLEEVNRYDLITLWHSLEHLPYLKRSAQRIAAALKPSGRLAVALPNPDSFDARYYRRRWAAWDAPRHLYHFKPQDTEVLFSAFHLHRVTKRAMPLDPFYHALLSELTWNRSPFVKVKAIRGLFVGVVSFITGLNADRASSVLYIFEKVED